MSIWPIEFSHLYEVLEPVPVTIKVAKNVPAVAQPAVTAPALTEKVSKKHELPGKDVAAEPPIKKQRLDAGIACEEQG